MSNFRGQDRLDGPRLPIVVNVMNFARGGEGEPCLLSFDEARTLFHEFGHALHGMLSDVTYPTLSGTRVADDFVEFPSQLYEHWIKQPEMLRRFARPLQDRRADARGASGQAAPGANASTRGSRPSSTPPPPWSISTCISCPSPDDLDVVAFERAELARIGMPDGISPRHRAPHFQHIFSGGYSAAYYSYLWSEVLDADGFEAFEEAGDIFDPDDRRPAARVCLFGRRQPRLRGGLSRVPRPPAFPRGAVPQAGTRPRRRVDEPRSIGRARRGDGREQIPPGATRPEAAMHRRQAAKARHALAPRRFRPYMPRLRL